LHAALNCKKNNICNQDILISYRDILTKDKAKSNF
jgi:hypothetical protein